MEITLSPCNGPATIAPSAAIASAWSSVYRCAIDDRRSARSSQNNRRSAQDSHSWHPNEPTVRAAGERTAPLRCDGMGGQRDRGATSSIDRDRHGAAWWRSFQRASSGWRLTRPTGRTTLAAEQLRPHRQRSPSPSVAVGALSPSNAANRNAASRRWSRRTICRSGADSWSETYVWDLAPTMSWNRAWRSASSRGSLHR